MLAFVVCFGSFVSHLIVVAISLMFFLEYEMHYIVTLMHIALQTRDFDGIRTLGYYTSFYGTANEQKTERITS